MPTAAATPSAAMNPSAAATPSSAATPSAVMTTPATVTPASAAPSANTAYAVPTSSLSIPWSNSSSISPSVAPYSGDATIPRMSMGAAALAIAGIAAGAFLL